LNDLYLSFDFGDFDLQHGGQIVRISVIPAGIPEAPLEDADAAEQLVAIPAFDIQSVAM